MKYIEVPTKLDDVWKECLRMWRWISDQVRKGNSRDINELKSIWFNKEGYVESDICCGCFFCKYDQEENGSMCSNCPGALVDPEFDCRYTEYDSFQEPIKFYNKLRSLNRKRLK